MIALFQWESAHIENRTSQVIVGFLLDFDSIERPEKRDICKWRNEMNRRNLDSMFATEAYRLDQSSQMLTHLLHATSPNGLEDADACVNAIESIVFELLARHLDGASRGRARRAYQAGIAAGLNDWNSDEGGAAVQDEAEGERSGALLKVIARAGWEHGRAIRYWIVLRHTQERVSVPGDSGSAEFRGATSTAL